MRQTAWTTYQRELVVDVIGFVLAVIAETASRVSHLEHRSRENHLVSSKHVKTRGLERLGFPPEGDFDLRGGKSS